MSMPGDNRDLEDETRTTSTTTPATISNEFASNDFIPTDKPSTSPSNITSTSPFNNPITNEPTEPPVIVTSEPSYSPTTRWPSSNPTKSPVANVPTTASPSKLPTKTPTKRRRGLRIRNLQADSAQLAAVILAGRLLLSQPAIPSSINGSDTSTISATGLRHVSPSLSYVSIGC
mmetsp:Transcript_5734/g.9785  ORF Transcript_5734/g.9785 Transcript_5734/m.9785 type:complete len:174 (+) Transcript_5734:600-1121(+)|eukprot:CAMPEP_0201907432 /NCGR_PEP_ID=MMETSP0902-20130614/57527_1 /ASSEMBLY_ACC=CAM_ASM_000551 /TAXON_ID=420261 /ORGANISM="Thalassiosira antarctica, Strain CCMP982" /LENGTH=173 /DNA_ID=CAMNT_0048441585 /DNA_START=463 /DNA_END=984 /DNA_ORIENTATION=-